MKPISFPEQTTVWAKDQPPYLPLPAYTNERETISLWNLTWGERLHVLFTGRVWLRQLNFGRPLQPQKLSVTSPFLPETAYGKQPETFGATDPSRQPGDAAT